MLFYKKVVSQLSTDRFLQSLSCSISRWGKPATIWSDNGTNFVGASNYLWLDDPEIQNAASNDCIKWIFNPPRAPHRGGLWESSVKSMKHHLLRVTNGQVLTFEELASIIYRIKAILNSRSLVSSKNADGSPPYLSPGHFLIGAPLVAEPKPAVTDSRLFKFYENQRRLIDSFWKGWYKDYLAQLQTRSKWMKEF